MQQGPEIIKHMIMSVQFHEDTEEIFKKSLVALQAVWLKFALELSHAIIIWWIFVKG